MYGFIGSFVRRKTVPEPSSHAGPYHPRLMTSQRACSSKDGNVCISETLDCVYFFDKYLTEGLAIGETPKLLLAKSCSAGWTAQERAMNRVLVVDDHTVIRRGIQNILRAWPEWEISGEAASGEEAVELTKELKPDIVLMDISMPGMGGLEATKLIRKIYPQAKILMLTLHDSPEWAEMALRAGARGYVLKSDSEGELLRALKVVAADGVYTSPSLDADRVKKIMGEIGLAG